MMPEANSSGRSACFRAGPAKEKALKESGLLCEKLCYRDSLLGKVRYYHGKALARYALVFRAFSKNILYGAARK